MSVENDLLSGTCEFRVKCLLEKYPELRDHDKKLYISYLNVFHFLKPRLDRHPNNAYQTLKEIIMDTKVPMFESVSRARRKIQEKTKSLRGLTYKERKTSAEVVKDWSLK